LRQNATTSDGILLALRPPAVDDEWPALGNGGGREAGADLDVICTTGAGRWRAVVSQTGKRDFYRLPRYREIGGACGGWRGSAVGPLPPKVRGLPGAARLSYRRPLPSVWRTNRPDSHRAVSIAIGAARLCRSPGYRVRGTTRAELLMVNDPGRVETGQGTVPSDTWCSGATNRWQCDRKVLFGRRQMAYRSKS